MKTTTSKTSRQNTKTLKTKELVREDIYEIKSYSAFSRIVGIGFLECDRLVEFEKHQGGPIKTNDITIQDAIQWMRAMDFADLRLRIGADEHAGAMNAFLGLVLNKLS